MKSNKSYDVPFDTEAVARLSAAFPLLPQAYLAFLDLRNGAEGPLAVEPGWCVVWSAEDALAASAGNGLTESLPGYFAFGSNGGGELLVMRIGEPVDARVFMGPAVGMAESELLVVADSFVQLVDQIGQEAH